MGPTLRQLQEWLAADEDEHLEFKEAKQQIDFRKLAKYCTALANEGLGRLILGATDRPNCAIIASADHGAGHSSSIYMRI